MMLSAKISKKPSKRAPIHILACLHKPIRDFISGQEVDTDQLNR